MPRTLDDIAYTDSLAARMRYDEPPAHLQPTGPMGEDDTWQDLVDWFDGRDIAWASAVEIYISRRWDQPIAEVYAMIDSWKKEQINRLDRASDPSAITNFN